MTNNCSGTGTITCTDTPGNGEWQYTDTPYIGTNWVGIESAKSSSVIVDSTPPTVAATVISQSANTSVNGYVRQNVGYYVYANVTDSVYTVASVTANLANVTTGDTSVALVSSGGPFTASGGGSYTYRSALLTSNASQADGLVHYTVNATDNLGNTSTNSNNGSLIFDSTPPSGGAFTANGTAASSGGSSSYLTSGTTLTINSRTDYTDSGSGLASSTLTIESAPLSGNACGSYGSPSTISGTTSQTVASGNCYLLTLTGTDNVGNTASISTTVMVDTSTPTLSETSSGANAYYPGTGSTIYYRATGSPSGSFTLTLTDTPTGISTETFPSITGWTKSSVTTTSTTASVTYTITNSATGGSETVSGTNGAGKTASGLGFTLTSDTSGPTGGAFTANGTAASSGGSSSYLTSGTTLTINSRTDYTDGGSGLASSTLTIESAPLSGNACGSYGSPSTISGTTSQTVASGNCYLLTLTGTDNVGNTASIGTTVKVDTTAPSVPSLVYSAETNVYASGNKVYYRPGATGGGFTVTASSSDAVSGIASYSFPSLGSGWTATPGSLGVEIYSWSSANPSTASGNLSVTATDGAGLTSSGSDSTNPFTMVADSTPPSGGAFTANGTAASSGGSSSYLTSGTTLTINSRTDYTDSGSGLASSTLTIESAPLSGNACGSYGSPSTISGTTSQTVASGNCYLLTLTGTDNVGNTASISTTVMVDTSTPTLSETSSGANAYYPGTGSTIYYRATGSPSGSFTLTLTDTPTGISTETFPSITGWTKSSVTTTSTTASVTYTITNSATGGSETVSGTNGAGKTASGLGFTLTSDTSGPTGGAFTANGTAASSGGSSSYLTSGTTLTINSRTDYTDGGSGLASSTLTIESAPLSGNACGSYGSPSTISGTTSQTVASGNCYLLTLTGTDNVGNTASIGTTVKVDTTAPSVPSLVYSAETNVYASGNKVYYRPGATGGGFTVTASSSDAVSGIASYSFPSLGSGWTATPGSLGVEIYSWSSANPSTASGNLSVTATDGAGLTSSGSDSTNPFTMVADSTPPSGGAFTANGTAASSGGSSSYLTSGTTLTINSRTDYTDSGSGLASSTLTIESAPLSGNACGSYGSPSTISGTTSQTVASGNCYLLTLTGTDNVGNTASISTTVMVDTSTPTLSETSSGANAYYPGTGSTIYYRATGSPSGSFTLTLTDTPTGISTETFPSITGWTKSSVTTTSTTASVTYTITNSATGGSETVSGTNGAGKTASGLGFTLTSDTSGPTGGAFTANGTAASSGGSSSYLTSGTTLTINNRTDYTDGGSGLASSTLTIESAPLSGNACGSYGSPSTISGTTSQTVASGNCYLLTLTGTDNVGNTASIGTTVKVDTTAPSVPSLVYSAETNVYASGNKVYYRPGATSGGFTVTASSSDAVSGIASYSFPSLGSGWTATPGSLGVEIYSWSSVEPDHGQRQPQRDRY